MEYVEVNIEENYLKKDNWIKFCMMASGFSPESLCRHTFPHEISSSLSERLLFNGSPLGPRKLSLKFYKLLSRARLEA